MIHIKRSNDGSHLIVSKHELPKPQSVRKKPIVVQAIHMREPFLVDTIEGSAVKGKAGDWLMIGIEGEMYPCDAGIFEKTYDILEESDDET